MEGCLEFAGGADMIAVRKEFRMFCRFAFADRKM